MEQKSYRSPMSQGCDSERGTRSKEHVPGTNLPAPGTSSYLQLAGINLPTTHSSHTLSGAQEEAPDSSRRAEPVRQARDRPTAKATSESILNRYDLHA